MGRGALLLREADPGRSQSQRWTCNALHVDARVCYLLIKTVELTGESRRKENGREQGGGPKLSCSNLKDGAKVQGSVRIWSRPGRGKQLVQRDQLGLRSIVMQSTTETRKRGRPRR